LCYDRRYLRRIYWLWFTLLQAVLAVEMPRCSAEAALEKRRARAIEHGYLTAHSKLDQKFVEVNKQIARPIETNARSVELHRQHDQLPGQCNHHGRLASFAARDIVGMKEFEIATEVRKAGGKAKQNISLAGSCGDTRTNKRWWEDDNKVPESWEECFSDTNVTINSNQSAKAVPSGEGKPCDLMNLFFSPLRGALPHRKISVSLLMRLTLCLASRWCKIVPLQ
jgi:hypothetical protein